MSTFDEYAAAVRQLSVQVREGERGAATEAERRRRLHAGVAQLGQRLAAQGQRLDQLGRAIGTPPETAAVPSGSGSAAVAPGSGSAAVPPVPGSPAVVSGPAGPAPGDGVAVPPGHVVIAPGGAAAPRAVGPSGSAVAPGDPALAGGDPGTDDDVDPGVVLEEARRLADEADRHIGHVEALGQRPELLPTWSPTARAVAVYVACAAAGVLLMLVLVVASGVGLVSGFTLGAWICAGLPVLSFAAGWFILGRWGRPALATVDPPRFVPLGFVICVALVPTAYCASLLLVRLLR